MDFQPHNKEVLNKSNQFLASQIGKYNKTQVANFQNECLYWGKFTRSAGMAL